MACVPALLAKCSEAALLLSLGAAHVTVVEYLPTEVEHANMR